MIRWASLNSAEKRTFSLHLSYAGIDGIVLGVLALNEFVFIKSLKGSDIQLSLLFTFSMAVFILLVFANEFLKRLPDLKKTMRYVALFTRLPLIVIAFFPDFSTEKTIQPFYHYVFLSVFFIYFLAAPIINPSVNHLLKNNYRHEHFGRLYSYASTLNRIMIFAATFLFGLLLDNFYIAFQIVYPVIGILSIIALYLLSSIRVEMSPEENVKQGFFTSVLKSLSRMYYIFKNDKAFLFFQIGFMFYGFAYLMTFSVINIYFNDGLHLNYSSVAIYKNLAVVVTILSLPFAGRMIGKTDPRKFGAVTFLFLALTLIFISVNVHFPKSHIIFDFKLSYFLIAAFVIYGFFASAMNILWSIGSAYFCRKEDAGIYQSVHLSLTGFRALFSPVLGIVLYAYAGFFVTFLTGAVLVIAGIIILIWSSQKHNLNSNR